MLAGDDGSQTALLPSEGSRIHLTGGDVTPEAHSRHVSLEVYISSLRQGEVAGSSFLQVFGEFFVLNSAPPAIWTS